VLSLVIVLLTNTPAAAHGQLAESTPADGEQISDPVQTVSLYFTEPPALDASFTVTSPDGTRVDAGWAYGEVTRLREPVQELFLENGAWIPRFFDDGYEVRLLISHLPATGTYSIEHSSVSSDGEEVEGTTTFRYDGEPTQQPAGFTPLPPPSVRPPLPDAQGRTVNEAVPPAPGETSASSPATGQPAAVPAAAATQDESGPPYLWIGVAVGALLVGLVGLRLLARRSQQASTAPAARGGTPKGSGQQGKNQPGKNQPGKNQPGKNQPGKNQPGKGQRSKSGARNR
jgi:methionine-rich copper-binding protein CopC